MKCVSSFGRLCNVLVLAAVLLFAISELVFAQAKIALDGNTIVPVNSQMPLALGAYSDQDKLNMGSPLWFDDLNVNSQHDPGEPFAATAQGGWLHPTSAQDNSCWLASGVNMLKQANLISDANGLYMDYALNGVPSPSGTLTWDDGGLQGYVIDYWKTQHPAQAANLTMNVLTWTQSLQFSNGLYAWQDVNPRTAVANYLAQGWQVGIGMWPLLDSSGNHYGGHALTIQQILAQSQPPYGTFQVTDSDRDADWSGPGDLNTYSDYNIGPVAYLGHNYYAWFNDFYSGDINYYPAGDVGYIAAIMYVPEPSVCLALAGMAGILLILRRRRMAWKQ